MVHVAFDSGQTFQISFCTPDVFDPVNRTDRHVRAPARRSADLSGGCLGAKQIVQVCSDQRHGAPAKKERPSLVDAGDVPCHVAGVNNIDGQIDDLTVMAFDAMTFSEASYLDKKLFMSEWHIQIVIGARVQSFEGVFIGLANTAD